MVRLVPSSRESAAAGLRWSSETQILISILTAVLQYWPVARARLTADCSGNSGIQ